MAHKERVDKTDKTVITSLSEGTTVKDVTRKLFQDGYRTMIGRLSMEEQLSEAWRYQREKDENGVPRFFVTSAKSNGSNFNVARMQAESLAKVQLAGLIETQVGQLVSNKMELSGMDSNTTLQTIASSKNLVTTRLSKLIPLLEIYKDLPNGYVEVQIVLGCSHAWANEIANKLVK